jgi:hypothetical protein
LENIKTRCYIIFNRYFYNQIVAHKEFLCLMIRPIEQIDAESCGKIGYEAHKAISSAHGYPSEQPSEEFGIGLIRKLLGNPNSWGVLAERQGKTLGSIFLHKFPPSPVAVIGPLTVHPSAEGGVGRMLMDAALVNKTMTRLDWCNLQVTFVPSYCIQSLDSPFVSLYF